MASGITCGAGVVEKFRSGVGMLQLHIVDESVEVAGSADAAGTDEAAFESAQAALKEETNAGGVIGGEPCYIALKLPSLDPSAAWVILLYIPAGSSVRDRMLYASTKDTVKKELGSSNFASDLYGNTKEELTHAAYVYKQDGQSSGLATAVEAELDDLVSCPPHALLLLWPCSPHRMFMFISGSGHVAGVGRVAGSGWRRTGGRRSGIQDEARGKGRTHCLGQGREKLGEPVRQHGRRDDRVRGWIRRPGSRAVAEQTPRRQAAVRFHQDWRFVVDGVLLSRHGSDQAKNAGLDG